MDEIMTGGKTVNTTFCHALPDNCKKDNIIVRNIEDTIEIYSKLNTIDVIDSSNIHCTQRMLK